MSNEVEAYVDSVPAHLRGEFRQRVCGCGSRKAFTLDLKMNWWVCDVCMKPAPLNAIKARLYRECEICEEYYWVVRMPDRNDTCPDCS